MYIKTPEGNLVEAQKPITIGDLFSMTAGFSYDFNTEGFHRAKEFTNGKKNTVETIKCVAAVIYSVQLMKTNRLTPELLKDLNWKQLAGCGYGLGVRTHMLPMESGMHLCAAHLKSKRRILSTET